MFAAALILAVLMHFAQPACMPMLSPESPEQYTTVGIRCRY